MCIYTVKKQNLKKINTNSLRGVRSLRCTTERHKIRLPGVRDTTKTNKDRGTLAALLVDHMVRY